MVVAVQCYSTLVYVGVGGLLFWRRSDNRMALLAATFLVLGGTVPTGAPNGSASAEIWDPNAPNGGQWKLLDNPMVNARASGHGAITLPNDKVLVVGGITARGSAGEELARAHRRDRAELLAPKPIEPSRVSMRRGSASSERLSSARGPSSAPP